MSDVSNIDLYRFFDATDRLLYVGISLNAAMRASQHKVAKSWWPDVARMEVQHLGYVDRRRAEDIERIAIINERPIFNVKHNDQPAHTEWKAEWRCAVCDRAIPDGDGYVEVDTSAAYACLRAEGANGDSIAQSLPVPWRALHRACDPDIARSSYWFDVARARTEAELLDWDSHLRKKRWIHATDWDEFIDRALSQ